MNHLTANKAVLRAEQPLEMLTFGMVNAVKCQVAFDAAWDGLAKIAVFSNGRASVDVPEAEWSGDVITVPPEMTARPGVTVRIGIYGTNGNSVVLPTVWCSLGVVQEGTDPTGDPSLDPKSPVWAQVLAHQQQLDSVLGELATPYTTLTRGRKGTLTVHCHGLQQGESYALHLYTVTRRSGSCYKQWRHTPNYDFDDSGKAVCRKGYGKLASRTYVGYRDENGCYPEVPEWMPNGGYLQTEWNGIFVAVAGDTDAIIPIDLRTWLLPMLKPKRILSDESWAKCLLIGVGGRAKAPLLMQWRIVRLSDGAVGECRQTLRVGVHCPHRDGVLTLDTEGAIEGLYTSIF